MMVDPINKENNTPKVKGKNDVSEAIVIAAIIISISLLVTLSSNMNIGV